MPKPGKQGALEQARVALAHNQPLVARPLLERILKRQPAHPEANWLLARCLRLQRLPADALSQIDRAIRLRPRDPQRHLERARILRDLGNLDPALNAVRKAVELDPDLTQADLLAATMLLNAGRPDHAVAFLRNSLSRKPDDPDLNGYLGIALINLGLPDEAVEPTRKALAAKPDIPELHLNLGRALFMVGRFDDAERAFRQADQLRPGDPNAAAGLIDVLISLRRDDDALDVWTRTAPDSRSPDLRLAFARLAPRIRRIDEAIDELQRTLRDGSAASRPDGGAAISLALGSLLERQGRNDDAFAAYQRAHERALPFDAQGHLALNARLRELFAPDRTSALPTSGNDSALPVFIVGMPRSGTSLIEQILASHPSIHGAGELDALRHLITSAPTDFSLPAQYPDFIPHLTADNLNAMAKRYLADLKRTAPADVLRITDKMPGNFTHLGLIHLMLPAARIIWCRRDPFDTCLSCYASALTALHPWAARLDSLGLVFREHESLMRFWIDSLPLQIIEVHYEQVVNNLEDETRRMLDFLGLPFDEACLRYWETDRATLTLSRDQVTQPVYTSSIGRWQRFEKHLAPLRQSLGIRS